MKELSTEDLFSMLDRMRLMYAEHELTVYDAIRVIKKAELHVLSWANISTPKNDELDSHRQ